MQKNKQLKGGGLTFVGLQKPQIFYEFLGSHTTKTGKAPIIVPRPVKIKITLQASFLLVTFLGILMLSYISLPIELFGG